MTEPKANKEDQEKLVEVIPPVSLDAPLPSRGLTNRKTRRIAEPHLRAHKVKGRLYYYYCRGIDPEIYLGDADTILLAVKGSK